jgi:ATP-dependent exoDNAse (exonuclease V) beta subunit
MEVQDYLDRLKVFEQDTNFKFDPGLHRYTYNGKPYTSVTTFLNNFHKPFEENKWLKIKSEERGITEEELKKEWKEKNVRSNVIGTGMHNWIEDYFNQKWNPLPTDIDIIERINKFNYMWVKHLHKLTPLKFEQRVFSKKYPLAGTIDSLFLYKDNLIIFDWKSNKEFTDDDHPKGRYEKLLDPLGDYWKNHHNEYSIQVSMYSEILEEWGFDVKMCYLLHIGPNTEPRIYRAHNLRPILKPWLENYFQTN